MKDVAKLPEAKRMCLEYHQLKIITNKNAYPFPRIEHILVGLCKAKYFVKLNNGISQNLSERGRSTHDGIHYTQGPVHVQTHAVRAIQYRGNLSLPDEYPLRD